MPRLRAPIVALLLPVIGACAAHKPPDRSGTLATLHQVPADTQEVAVKQGLDRAMQSYGEFLKQAPDSALAPEAMRRLADLKLEKEFGIQGDGKLIDVPASQGNTPANPVVPASTGVPTAAVDSRRRDPAATLHGPVIAKIDAPNGVRSQ